MDSLLKCECKPPFNPLYVASPHPFPSMLPGAQNSDRSIERVCAEAHLNLMHFSSDLLPAITSAWSKSQKSKSQKCVFQRQARRSLARADRADCVASPLQYCVVSRLQYCAAFPEQLTCRGLEITDNKRINEYLPKTCVTAQWLHIPLDGFQVHREIAF